MSRVIPGGTRCLSSMALLSALRALGALLALIAPAALLAKPIDTAQHLGVASCVSGVCHGKLTKQTDSNVWLNEGRIWLGDDRHARAYQTLLSDESRTIAAKLGLPNAQGAQICLDCHKPIGTCT